MIFFKHNPAGEHCKAKRQEHGQLVDVALWGSEEIEPYQQGARAKNKVYCPAQSPFPFLLANHDYLFKQSHKRYPAQFWVEVIAYRLGCLMDVPVPPAFVGIDSNRQIAGAVIEWFYNYPNEPREEYTSGGDLIQHLIPNYDRKKGKQHNVTDLLAIISEIERGDDLAQNWQEHWAKVFCFDALIGNTDRHQDNWGILHYDDHAYFAPAFDNGTAMGHEITEENLSAILAAPEKYVLASRATHHLKWERDDVKKVPHFELLQRLIKQYPAMIEVMRGCAGFSVAALTLELDELLELSNALPAPYGKLTPERAKFIIDLTDYRRKILLEMLK